MRSLEWACAKDRAGRKWRKRRHGARDIFDVPPLPPLDLGLMKEDEDTSETEVEEVITPDNSMELAQLHTPVRKRVPDWDPQDESMKENEPPNSKGQNTDVEAAIALLGFKVRT